MALAAWIQEREGAQSGHAHLGSISANGSTDHVELRSLVHRVVIEVANGATNPVTFAVGGSLDGVNWSPLILERDFSDGSPILDRTVAAGVRELLPLDPRAVPRFVRVNVTAANANGTEFTLYAER